MGQGLRTLNLRSRRMGSGSSSLERSGRQSSEAKAGPCAGPQDRQGDLRPHRSCSRPEAGGGASRESSRNKSSVRARHAQAHCTSSELRRGVGWARGADCGGGRPRGPPSQVWVQPAEEGRGEGLPGGQQGNSAAEPAGRRLGGRAGGGRGAGPGGRGRGRAAAAAGVSAPGCAADAAPSDRRRAARGRPSGSPAPAERARSAPAAVPGHVFAAGHELRAPLHRESFPRGRLWSWRGPDAEVGRVPAPRISPVTPSRRCALP